FGREVYVAWRLSAGDALYRDIDYFNGPVSPYFNALMFKLFGAHILTLEIANIAIWAVLAAMAYRLYVQMSDRLGAFAAVGMFIVLMSFVQFNDIPIFNFVCPYAHEITHALMCAYGLFTALSCFLSSGRRSALLAMGILLGLIALMKVEITVAAGAAVMVVVAFHLRRISAPIRQWFITPTTVMGAAMIPPLVAWALLCRAMSAEVAWRGVLGSWKFIGDSRLTNNPFYRGLAGTDQPLHCTLIMLAVLGTGALALAPAAALAWFSKRKTSSMQGWGIAAAIFAFLVLWYEFDSRNWSAAGRPLNLITACSAVIFMVMALRRPRKSLTPRLILQASFCVFAFVLLIKLLFTTPLYHYGFALCTPALAVGSMLLASWIPSAVHRAGGNGGIFRLAVLVLLTTFCWRHLAINVHPRPGAAESYPFGTPDEHFLVNVRGPALQRMLALLHHEMSPSETLACVPEGAMFNFLLHAVNPTGELVLLPGEVQMFGEGRILDRFSNNSPRWILVVPRDTVGFGYKGFGVDYAQSIDRFLGTHYRDVTPPEVIDDSYPLHLLKRIR
ncbi:MAG: hypothetical protein JO353_12375, partial [Phycisphaerae bacterium]|nr:hypothetical protein [Phycisphaerae bacterium]